jgi:hypothetical protein
MHAETITHETGPEWCGRLTRMGPWCYAPPTGHNETGQPAEEMPL